MLQIVNIISLNKFLYNLFPRNEINNRVTVICNIMKVQCIRSGLHFGDVSFKFFFKVILLCVNSFDGTKYHQQYSIFA